MIETRDDGTNTVLQPRASREGERAPPSQSGGTSTHRIEVNADAYTSVSNGNVNCTMLIKSGQTLRFIIAQSQPRVDEPQYIAVSGPGTSTARANVITARDLYAGDALWVRTEEGETEVRCIRGPALIEIELTG